MVEAVMLWNEPNNLSHWDFKLDPEWKLFAEMVLCRGARRSAASILSSRWCWAAFRRSIPTS